jgi:thioesterase domain-containing protein/acyl carrier protein
VAVEGIETYVLDPERWPPVPVAPGEIGELWLGGAGLARGYHRRPAWTAARFVAVEACGGQRLYRTGDRVRQGPRGELEFLGRLDRQVKIAGHRVEPGEVEAVLREIPGIVDAAVLPVVGERGPLRLAAWVVLQGRTGEEVSIAAIRAAAGLRLPSFLRPTRITPIAALPRSSAGKVDFRALQEIRSLEKEGLQAPSVPHLPNPPRDGIEATLAALWERLLGAGEVSRDADFFDLGGDSLTAVVLLLEIEKLLGRRVRLASLLRAPTLAALAEVIRTPGEEDRPRSSCLVPLQPAGQAPPLVCVHGLGGHLLRLIPLARSLAPDQPFLGLESPGLDDDEPIPKTVEDLARLFLRELRQRVGSGPYHLCGMSFGGIVAFEMARQAKAAGEEIALLALFDTDLSEVLPGFKPEGPDRIDQLLGRLRRTVGDRLGRSRRHARRLLQGQDGVEKANEYRHYTRVLRENDRALARYRPGPYAGTVTYFAATERDPAVFAEFVRQTGCDLEIVPTPGDHLGMLEPPHVEVLAGELRRLAAAAPPMSGGPYFCP